MKKDKVEKVIRVAPLILSMGLVTITSSYSGNHAQKLFNKETIDKSNEIDSSVKKDDWINENWKDDKKKQKTIINRKLKRSKK